MHFTLIHSTYKHFTFTAHTITLHSQHIQTLYIHTTYKHSTFTAHTDTLHSKYLMQWKWGASLNLPNPRTTLNLSNSDYSAEQTPNWADWQWGSKRSITFEPVTEELEPEVRQASVFLLDDLTDVLEGGMVTVEQGLTLCIVIVVLQVKHIYRFTVTDIGLLMKGTFKIQCLYKYM